MPKRSTWFVYIVQCGDGSLYTGITTHLAKRLRSHAIGRGSAYVRSKRLSGVVYVERRMNRSTATRREWEIKSLTREEKLSLIVGQHHT